MLASPFQPSLPSPYQPLSDPQLAYAQFYQEDANLLVPMFEEVSIH